MTNFYLARMLPQSLPSLDWRVLGFAVALALVIGLLIGLIPVFHLLRTNLAEVIQSSSRSASSSRGVRALSGVLVVAQVAVALMLLTGAGLLIHSFAEALRVDTGLEATNVVTAHRVDAGTSRQRRGRQQDSRTPAGDARDSGRDVGGAVLATPFQGDCRSTRSPWRTTRCRRVRRSRARSDRDARVRRNAGAEAGGRPLLRRSAAPGRRLFVVDQSFARKFSRMALPLVGGSRSPAKPEDWPVIIGVVKDVPHNGVEEKSGNPFIYQVMQGGRPGGLTLFLRTNRPTGDVVSALREKVRAIDPRVHCSTSASCRKPWIRPSTTVVP